MFIIQVDSGEQKVPVDNAISAVQKCYLFCANFFCLNSFCGRPEHAARCEVYFYTSVMKYCQAMRPEKKKAIVGWFNGSFSVFYVISPVICRDKSDAR